VQLQSIICLVANGGISSAADQITGRTPLTPIPPDEIYIFDPGLVPNPEIGPGRDIAQRLAYAENSDSGILAVQSAKDQMRYHASRAMNWA
jgi:hypothetical protein